MTFTYAQLADAAELDVLGKRSRLEVCRQISGRSRYPDLELDRMAERPQWAEEIAACMRRAAEREAKQAGEKVA